MEIFDRKEALEQADKILDSRCTESGWKAITEVSSTEDTRRRVLVETIVELWDYLMHICEASFGEYRTPLNPEKAMAELVRRGLGRDSIDLGHYPKISFRIGGIRYIILKSHRCFSIYPCRVPAKSFFSHESHDEHKCTLIAEEFADFVFSFDALVPELERKTEAYVWQVKSAEMQREIAERSIAAYEAEVLSPSRISFEVKKVSGSGVIVVFGRFGYEDLEMEIPLDSLPAILPEIPSRMVPLKVEKKKVWASSAGFKKK